MQCACYTAGPALSVVNPMSKHPTRLILLLVCWLALPAWATDAGETGDDTPSSIRQQTVVTGIPVESLRDFARVMTLIRQNYVNPVSDETLINAAIDGMVSSLDPHSAWLDKSGMADLRELTDGSFGGLGIEIGSDQGHVRIITPLDDTPASRAGIQPGDEILEINGKSVQGQSINDVVGQLRGKAGSQVSLTLKRAAQPQPVKVKLTRENIRLESVKSRLLTKGYGYVRITQFQENTAADLEAALQKLTRNTPFYGLVLDLRNNPGGVLEAAVGAADAFLNQGLIVYTQGRTPDTRTNYSATAGDLLDGLPLVVLVNSGTASAAEIVAGALKDQQRAVIAGQQTFGKGSVQSVIPLGDDKALKLTIARYYTPSGHSIQAQGITPDILLDPAQAAAAPAPADTLREADLPHHLANPDQDRKPAPNDNDRELERQDYGLYQALSLLRAIHLAQPGPDANGDGTE